jgi:hypothetical protein
MQTKMNTFPAWTKKGLPYSSGRRPTRVMREGARPVSRSRASVALLSPSTPNDHNKGEPYARVKYTLNHCQFFIAFSLVASTAFSCKNLFYEPLPVPYPGGAKKKKFLEEKAVEATKQKKKKRRKKPKPEEQEGMPQHQHQRKEKKEKSMMHMYEPGPVPYK